MMVYKFRDIVNNFERVVDIIENDQFYCPLFFDLNDPMEGIFETNHPDKIKMLYDQKVKTRICSFSGELGFINPSIWGYYTNGFNGVAIKVHTENVYPIFYTDNPFYIEKIENDSVKRLLLQKGTVWRSEDEFRYLSSEKDEDKEKIKIGRIDSIYFGNPYNDLANSKDIHSSMKNYNIYIENQKELMRIANNKKIPCYSIKIVSGIVRVDKELK